MGPVRVENDGTKSGANRFDSAADFVRRTAMDLVGEVLKQCEEKDKEMDKASNNARTAGWPRLDILGCLDNDSNVLN